MAERKRLFAIGALASLLASSGASAIDVNTGSEDLTFSIHTLLQPRFEMDFDGPPDSAAPSGHANFDFFIRRAGLLAKGTAYKQFTFAIVFNVLRLGERGNFNVSPSVRDVVVGYVPLTDVNIEMGLLYMPLTHAALESAADGSALEGPGDILLYNNARNLRETGVQLRALFLDRRILVRGGLYEGARNTNPPTAPALNPQGVPLSAGMIRLNLVGEETAYAYPGIYLDGKTRVSIGMGGQYQPHSGGLQAGTNTYSDYISLATDLFADVALTGRTEAVLTIGGYRFDYGAGDAKTGNGVHGEVGFRWGPIEPQGNFYWFNSDTKKNSYLKVAGGLNFFLQGHHAKLQVEFASVIANANLDTTQASHRFVVQSQLAF
jgi:Phosphate-selective porin O and P